MPTLHLIDADSTQACPAVLVVIAQALKACPENQLLLLGGEPLAKHARAAGIDNACRLAVPYGRALLGLVALRRWLKCNPGCDHVRCWSIGALTAATLVMRRAPKSLTLVHTPSDRQLLQLCRLTNQHNPRRESVQIAARSQSMRDRLIARGLGAESVTVMPEVARSGAQELAGAGVDHAMIQRDRRQELRRSWGVNDERRPVIALLSDHPDLTDALGGATIACLAGETLTNPDASPAGVTLLTHPGHRRRRHAQEYLVNQDHHHHIVQDDRLGCPWLVLPGCDAALAIGPDAGGLSLAWASACGLPIILQANGCALEDLSDTQNVLLSPSPQHKDAAHLLHGLLVESALA